MPLESIHIIIGIGSIAVTAFLAYIGLKIKLEVATGRGEILQSQEKIAGALDTHVKLDEVTHAQINKHLESTDNKIEKLEYRRFRN